MCVKHTKSHLVEVSTLICWWFLGLGFEFLGGVFKLTSLTRTAMQERARKLSVRKTDRQIQATLLHPWFKLPFQPGTELCHLHLIPSTWSGARHQRSSAHTGLHMLASLASPSDAGGPGNPLTAPCNIGGFYISLPLAGTADPKL